MISSLGGDVSFQSTRPVRGATGQLPQGARAVPGFNPRAPCGARRGLLTVTVKFADLVSIHAPRAGRDQLAAGGHAHAYVVSIHAPRAGRDVLRPELSGLVALVSIHAPRAGRDPCPTRASGPSPRCFNPRAPCGARQHEHARDRKRDHVSIHAPRAGRDVPAQGAGSRHSVSIHAPRAGRDRS